MKRKNGAQPIKLSDDALKILSSGNKNNSVEYILGSPIKVFNDATGELMGTFPGNSKEGYREAALLNRRINSSGE